MTNLDRIVTSDYVGRYIFGEDSLKVEYSGYYYMETYDDGMSYFIEIYDQTNEQLLYYNLFM